MAKLAKLVLDAPPGEIDAVRRDIEILSKQSVGLRKELESEMCKANLNQLRIVEVGKQLTVVSKYNQLDNAIFFTHGHKPQKFKINHITCETEILGDYSEQAEVDIFTTQKEVEEYVKDHYVSQSVACTFVQPDESIAIIVIGRKLSPQNFFNGQFTAQYILTSSGQLKGTINVDVHYFEEGNVRLNSSKEVSCPTTSGIASALLRLENEFEEELSETLVQLNEREFKALRRQLPVTRQQMVWGKAVAGYKLGKELERR